MKLWTYQEASTKLITDQDLQDLNLLAVQPATLQGSGGFITPNELVGYFNEGIEEAEAEILKLDEDYLLTSAPVPLITGQAQFALPYNLYGYKLRGIMYSNGTTIYEVRKFKRKSKFLEIAYAQQYGVSDDYRYFLTNDSPGQAFMNLLPPSRETAVLAPNASPFTPMKYWYIRQAQRIPLVGEYVPNYDQILQASAIDTAGDKLTIGQAYVTGDQVKLSTTGTMPGGLTAGTAYYAINSGSGTIKLATSLANANAGTAIDITTTGAGVLTLSIAANQTIVNNTIIDIPEFVRFVIQYAKCRCLDKDGDPRLAGATAVLGQLRQLMVETLTDAQPDDDNEVTPDFSSYNEMS